MSKRIVLMSVLLTMLVSLAGVSASAIDTSMLTSFLYQGSSYVPLKSTASFLGAPLRWDANTGQAIITYNGQDLALTPNSRKATYAGRSVMLSSQPIVVNGVTYIPTQALSKYYNVPVTWNGTRSEMRIKGQSGWRTMKVNSRPPWHGGPPPWAPAWGRRGNGTPGRSINVNTNGNRNGKGPTWGQRRYSTQGRTKNAKAKAWGQRGQGAQGNPNNGKAWNQRGQDGQGHPGNGKANGNGKAKAWGQRGYSAPGHPNNGKANGNGKAKGNKKGH